MKSTFFKLFSVLWLIAAVGCVVYIFATSFRPLVSEPRSSEPGEIWLLGGDFELRMNEIECVRSGVDPYLVWHQDLSHSGYFPNARMIHHTDKTAKPINAYTPWEYTFLMPLQMLGSDRAWWCYLVLLACATLFLGIMAFRHGFATGNLFDGCLCAAAALSPILGIWMDVRCGNYSLLITAMGVLFLWLIAHKHDYLAGLVFAFMMIKPQLCILLVVPLLITGRLMTVVIAALTCILASLPPALMTGRSVLTLILEAPKASAHAFHGCMLFPEPLFRVCQTADWDVGSMMIIPMTLGIVLCVALTLILKKHKQPFHIVLMPSVFFSVAWTYSYWYSFCFYSLLALPLTDLMRMEKHRVISITAFVTLVCCMFGAFYVAKALQLLWTACGGSLSLPIIESIRIVGDVAAIAGMCGLPFLLASSRQFVAKENL